MCGSEELFSYKLQAQAAESRQSQNRPARSQVAQTGTDRKKQSHTSELSEHHAKTPSRTKQTLRETTLGTHLVLLLC